MNVIFHVDEMEETYQIEVLANGPAVRAYLPSALADSLSVIMAQAKAEGVVFAACRNALRAQSIALETLIEKTTVVPAGVVELAQKQQAGFAYIKP